MKSVIIFKSKAQCNECTMLCSLESTLPRMHTMHGLKSHHQKNHKDLYSMYVSNVSTSKSIGQIYSNCRINLRGENVEKQLF